MQTLSVRGCQGALRKQMLSNLQTKAWVCFRALRRKSRHDAMLVRSPTRTMLITLRSGRARSFHLQKVVLRVLARCLGEKSLPQTQRADPSFNFSPGGRS
eukprot:730231-Alexandrium_andersonii.AAC.1